MNFPLPIDVATIKSQNDSLLFVLLFSTSDEAEQFHTSFMDNSDLKLDLLENDKKEISFRLFSESNSVGIVVPTKRTFENNKTLGLILDENYKDYLYITFGYKTEQQVLYNQQYSYPVFLNYLPFE